MPYISREKLAERPKTLNAEQVIKKYFPESNIDNILEIANDGHFGVYIKSKNFVSCIYDNTKYRNSNCADTKPWLLEVPHLVRLNNSSGFGNIQYLIDKDEIKINPASPTLWFGVTQEEKDGAGIAFRLNPNKILNPNKTEFRITKDDLLFIESEIKDYLEKNGKKTSQQEKINVIKKILDGFSEKAKKNNIINLAHNKMQLPFTTNCLNALIKIKFNIYIEDSTFKRHYVPKLDYNFKKGLRAGAILAYKEYFPNNIDWQKVENELK